uniref:Uncharacterized protein n=1 Tax=Salix viminalis TaxID=40686 RepID=A0A6N2KVL2_SALVM
MGANGLAIEAVIGPREVTVNGEAMEAAVGGGKGTVMGLVEVAVQATIIVELRAGLVAETDLDGRTGAEAADFGAKRFFSLRLGWEDFLSRSGNFVFLIESCLSTSFICCLRVFGENTVSSLYSSTHFSTAIRSATLLFTDSTC